MIVGLIPRSFVMAQTFKCVYYPAKQLCLVSTDNRCPTGYHDFCDTFTRATPGNCNSTSVFNCINNSAPTATPTTPPTGGSCPYSMCPLKASDTNPCNNGYVPFCNGITNACECRQEISGGNCIPEGTRCDDGTPLLCCGKKTCNGVCGVTNPTPTPNSANPCNYFGVWCNSPSDCNTTGHNDLQCINSSSPNLPKGCTGACVTPTPTTATSTSNSKTCDFIPEPTQKADCNNCFENKGGSWTAIGCIPTNPSAFIGTILNFAIGIAGGIAFLLILLGAFQIMTSAGNPEQLNAGRELVTSAITGLILIIFSVFLLKVIGVDILGLPNFRP
jgi:hypothetical protein